MNHKEALTFLTNICDVDSGDESGPEESDLEEEEIIENQNCIDDDSEEDDSEEEVPAKSQKSAETWRPIRVGNNASFRNVIEFTSANGLTLFAKSRIKCPLSAFRLLMDENIFDNIVRCTNRNPSKPDNWNLDKNTLWRFIAVLFCRGLYCPNTSVKSCWNSRTGPLKVKELLSRNKF